MWLKWYIECVVSSLGVVNFAHSSLRCANVAIWLCLAATNASRAQLGAAAAQALEAKQPSYLLVTIMVSVGVRIPGALWPAHSYVSRLKSDLPPIGCYVSDDQG